MTKKRLIIALLAVTSLIAVILLIRPHWLSRVPTAQITYNGNPSGDSQLYRVRNGEFILRLNEREEIVPYWIKKKKIFLATPSNFAFFSLVAFVWHNDQYGVNLGDKAKTDVEPQIIAGDNFIEFTSLKKRRVRVSW